MFTKSALLLEGITGHGIMLLDAEGTIKYFNAATLSITGFEATELLENPFSLFYSEEDRQIDRLDLELSRAQKAGKYEQEGWLIKKDGHSFWADLTFTPVYNENKELEGFACVLKDKTERKLQEQRLLESEELYRLMVESVRDYAIFLLDPTGHIMTWNEGAQRIKGYRPKEIIGKHFSTFYTREDLEIEKPKNELIHARKYGKYEEEGWRVRKNGSLFWANVVITALFNSNNELIGFSKVTRDLTEKREADEALRLSEERYRSLVEQVKDYGIFMLDEKGRIISWNEGARRINGYTAEDVIGKYFSIFYSDEDKLNNKPGWELQIVREKGQYEDEGWRIRKNGSKFWASVLITAVYNKEGDLIGFSKVTRDLTERKEAEKELKESRERYKKLAQEFKAANERLAYTNNELEQFTSIVSHDLQEPIRTAKSFLQLIDMKLGKNDPAELRLYIEKATAAANRMQELIRNLLNYSQLDKGELEVEEVNVADLFSEAIQNLKSAIDATGADVQVATEVETIKGNRVQLVQLVQNLMSNALKFNAGQKPLVKVKCVRDGGKVVFSVTDNGIGIAQQDLHKIFDVFRRLNNKKEYPGTGIGLAICKKIVDQHKGQIWPESEPGKGTTFYVTMEEKNPIPETV